MPLASPDAPQGMKTPLIQAPGVVQPEAADDPGRLLTQELLV